MTEPLPPIHRARGLSEFYPRLERHFTLAVGYCEVPSLPFIIRACRLKPYKMLHGSPTARLVLHKQWIDEHGNSLYLEGAKKLKIVLNDLTVDRSRLAVTDLYHGLSVEKISRISKRGILLVGKQENYCLLSLLGIDDHLRTFVWWRGEWTKYSSLYLGMELLQRISEIDLVGYQEVEGNVLALHRCKSQKPWMTQWPPSEEFVLVVKEQDFPALDFIKETISE